MREFEMVREREPDPEAASYEWRYGHMAKRRRQLDEGVVVVRGKDRQWEISPQSRGKYMLWPQPPAQPGVADPGPPWAGEWARVCVPYWQVFLHNMHTTEDGVTTSGQHRHQGGLGLFILDGEGYSIVDEVRRDWKAGDFLMLPIKPGGCTHQHFAKWGTHATWLALIWEPWALLSGGWVEQLKVGSLKVPPPKWTSEVAHFETAEAALQRLGSAFETRASDNPGGLYGELLRIRDAERDRLSKSSVVVEGDKAPVENTPMGTIRWYTHPALDTPALKTYLLWTHEIPEGSRTGRMRHQGGRIHYVLEGEGYTVIDGVQYSWEQGDVVCIPIKAFGVEYQHFNTGSGQAKLLTAEINLSGTMGIDVGVPWDVVEPAPEYRRS